jgi:hypothetical protein
MSFAKASIMFMAIKLVAGATNNIVLLGTGCDRHPLVPIWFNQFLFFIEEMRLSRVRFGNFGAEE